MDTSNIILPNWLMRCAENIPQHLAIQCGAIRWTFAELHQQATHLAKQFATLGIQSGSRVAVLAGSGLPYVTCVHALIRLNAIMVPLNIRLTQAEHCWQLQDVQATFLINDTHHTSRASAINHDLPHLSCATITLDSPTHTISLAELPETDIALQTLINLSDIQSIMYTSGTTGTPKGVIITYGMEWWNTVGSALNLGHRPDDCWLACMPLFHIGGLMILLRSVINGISIVLFEKFDEHAINQAIQELHVTIISVVSIMLQRMLIALDTQQQSYPSSLRCVLLGGGPAPQPLLEDCANRHIPVVQTYGLTESCSQAVTLSPTDALRKLGSAGRPLPQIQLQVRHNDQPAVPGEAGIIYLKGPSITSGYDHRPQATAEAIHNGWLSTGDLGYLDAEGYLYILDRRSDLIISGGENVYPAEIEAVLLSHPTVSEAGVTSQDDAQWGQVPIAFVCLHEPAHTTTNELLTYAEQHLARYKLPRKLYIVKQLPRNASGKLLRRELRNLLP